MTNKIVKRRSKPPAGFDDNPAWTDADLARAQPAREVMPDLVETMKRRRGRPTEGERPKVPVSLRLDPEVLNAYKATGNGWQRRINDTLAKGAAKLRVKA